MNEKLILFIAFFILVFIRISLWVLPFRILQMVLSKMVRIKSSSINVNLEIIEKITHFVKIESRFIPYATCLTQALAALVIIRFFGQDAELKFGIILSSTEKFAAHAWIEKEGKIVLGKLPQHQKFKILESPTYAVL